MTVFVALVGALYEPNRNWNREQNSPTEKMGAALRNDSIGRCNFFSHSLMSYRCRIRVLYCKKVAKMRYVYVAFYSCSPTNLQLFLIVFLWIFVIFRYIYIDFFFIVIVLSFCWLVFFSMERKLEFFFLVGVFIVKFPFSFRQCRVYIL